MEKLKQSRREFIKTSALVGSSLLVSFTFPGCSPVDASPMATPDGNRFIPNAWIKIDPEDNITIMVNHSEMGQGVLTSLPMIVAEEMEADWNKVRSEHAPVADVYKNPAFGVQATGGSTSLTSSWEILREAGASAKFLFMTVASQTWKVPVSECFAEKSVVIHKPSGKKLRYGELIASAATIKVPEEVSLKDPKDFTIIGQRFLRLDTAAKANGSAIFGVDVKIPGMLNATIVHPPVFSSQVKAINDQKALAIKGVKQVVEIKNGVAVVADTFWQAKMGADALEIEWNVSETVSISSDSLRKRWLEKVKEEGKTRYEIGDVDDWLGKGLKTVEAVYELPFQAHATQEPMSCTADVRSDGCDIYAPTQGQGPAHALAVMMTGLDSDSVKVHTTFLGGGFGRKSDVDYIAEAVEISMKVGKPIKLIWTREEDMQHDSYRPASVNAMTAVLDENKQLVAWRHRIVGPDQMLYVIPPMLPAIMPGWVPNFVKSWAISLITGSIGKKLLAGRMLTGGAGPLPYNIPNVKLEYVYDDPGIPVGFWRSVANSSNGFVVDAFLDEVALAVGKDPLDIRLELLSDNPRLKNVLEQAADRAGWGKKLSAGHYQGLASHDFHHTLVAMVAEISINDAGEVKVHRVVCAVDCGTVVNPKTVELQIESGIVFGLTATLKSSISIKDGRVQQSNFDDFPVLRMEDMPEVEVIIVQNQEKPTGIGEVGVPPIAPAIANAIFAATGKRLRKIPILPSDLV